MANTINRDQSLSDTHPSLQRTSQQRSVHGSAEGFSTILGGYLKQENQLSTKTLKAWCQIAHEKVICLQYES